MILGLKRRIISRFLQSAKLTEKQNIQEIQRCLEDGISFSRVWNKTPCQGRVLKFDCVNYPTHYDFFHRVTLNNEVSKSSNTIFLHEAPNVLAEAVLTDIHEHAENFGKIQAMEFNKYFNGKKYVDIPKNENVVVKLSHKNIADPFNVGHLRRIMFGRFVTNITKLFNKNVTSINYLHDWADMMATLVLKWNEIFVMKEDKRIDLSDVFGAKYDHPQASVYQIVRFVKSLEQGDQKALETWQKCRNVCVGDHEKMYQKLGIKFDVTCAQSHYTEQTNQVISMAKEKNLLLLNEKTNAQYIDVTKVGDWKPRHIKFLSDYLAYEPRDVAAIFDVFSKYTPDRLIYVSDLKMKYLDNLERIGKKLRPDQPGHIQYATFNSATPYWRDPLSTSDILDELMISKTAIMLKHKLGEDCESLSDVSDNLSISRFAMQNFKSKRCKNFLESFYPDKMKKAFDGREGVTLQCTHARLCRLIMLYKDDYSFKSVDFNLLSEDCAIRLVQHLARYPEVLTRSYVELEAHHLVHYLITLVNLEHIAYEELLVFNQPKKIRDARLALFKCTRQVLANGMNILGIQPLGKI